MTEKTTKQNVLYVPDPYEDQTDSTSLNSAKEPWRNP